MPELIYKERLQPSLLDRLTDEAPDSRQESRTRRVMSSAQLRHSVLRDLSWLLNAVHMEALVDLEALPLVQKSVLNFGMPNLAGRTLSGLSLASVADQLREAIVLYEPRLLPDTVHVQVERAEGHNSVSFHIEAVLWSQPLPLQLFLRTDIDLEDGEVRVTDQSGAGGERMRAEE